ncbi:MAG: hypothetical protein U1E29_08160 [Coriobacteriia bacterium]|nr:hypothetical protein [Coriobacteriia bacterium]
MRLPLDVLNLARSGSQIESERTQPVRIAIFIEVDAPDVLVDSVREHLRPMTAGAKLHIEIAEPGTKLIVDPGADAVIGVAGGGSGGLRESLAEARERSVPTVVVALSSERDDVSRRLAHPLLDTLATDDDVEYLVSVDLGDWLSTHLSGKRLALAHNFTFMRRAVAFEYAKNTAVQNALIGGITIIPGADMPLMTANQAKMVLQIAAAYGERLGAERARELLGVVGGAFALRTVARQFAALVPGFGWAVKGSIGYAGTLAMGYAAIKFFEGDIDTEELRKRFETLRSRLPDRIKMLKRAKAEEAVEHTNGV